MIQILFKGKLWRAGNSWVVTIPSDYVENKLIPTNEEITFYITRRDIQYEELKERMMKELNDKLNDDNNEG